MKFDPTTYEKLGAFYLGREAERPDVPVLYDSRDLTTHALCVGMTGSGKTGLCIGLLEEALIDRVPAIVIDPKGDIGNLLLTFPGLTPEEFEPWVDPADAERKGISVSELAAAEAEKWREGLASWGQTPERIQALKDAGNVTIYTPGSSAGRGVSILGSLAAPSAATVDDAEAFADRVSDTVTSLLALLGINADPLQDPEHVFLSTLLTDFWRKGLGLDLATLIRSIQKPPFDRIGVMDLDDVFGGKARSGLAMKMNNLLAAPAFAPWLEGDDLDIDAFLGREGKPQVAIFSIAHLDDAERMFFVSLLFGKILDWTRQQSGTGSLRALIYMDEIFGFLPPVANPPSKRPMLAMLKQARAFGVGLVLATQNPVDLDYKALSNMGTWFLGRLQTERDVQRVVDGLLGADESLDRPTIEKTLAGLQSRQFLLHNVHEDAPRVFETRWVLSYLRGPLTREDIRKLSGNRKSTRGRTAPSKPSPTPAAIPTERNGAHLPIRVPGADDEKLVWRPMAYGAGSVPIKDARRGVDEQVDFGFVRGLRGGVDFRWDDSTAVVLDHNEFGDSSSAGEHLEADPDAGSDSTWAAWKKALKGHVARNVTAVTYSCPKLRLKPTTGESEAAFRGRVDLAIREKRDAAVDKLRTSYERKVDRLDGQLSRAREALGRQEDQARDAKLNAAVNVGEAIWGMLGGRRRSVSSSRATRVIREGRDVDRAEEKVEDLVSELYDLQSQMEAALIDEAGKYGPEAYPLQTIELPAKERNVDVHFCELVWVPYWTRPDGSRRRAS